MQQNRITILCTRPLNDSLLAKAKRQGIDIDVLSFIETEPVRTIEVQQEVEQAFIRSAAVVFTSMNAVEAVTEQLDGQQPDWSIYCMGNTTQQLVKKYFGEAAIAGTAADAAELAETIVEDETIDEVFFFCGNQRRDDLPRILNEHNIEVNEIVVYSTIATPHKIDKAYNGILFFSPSAADSFFAANKLGKETILFAIGNTTAAAIRKYTSNRIVISEEPGKENLVQQMIGFFIDL